MTRVCLGEVAREHKETLTGSKEVFPIVGLEHLDPDSISLLRWDENVENTFSKVFRKGNVLFGRRRAYLRKAAVAPFDGICSGDIIVIEANESKILPDLLPFVIQNRALFDYAVEKSAGSLSPRVKWENLRNYEFNLPDMDKQKEIAELLWSIECAKSAYSNLIKTTDDLVKSQFIEMFGNPVSNNKGWNTKKLKVVAPEYTPQIPEEEKYWWLNLDMIESNTGWLIEKVMANPDEIGNSTSTFDNTMVLYSKLRPYLNKVIVPESYGYATTELVGMKPDEEILDKYFLFNLLRGDDFLRYANGLSAGGQMPRMPMK